MPADSHSAKGAAVAGINRVWNRIKASAEKHARGRGILSVREAKLEVAKFCQSEKTAQPPDDALEYLAGELVRLTGEGHDAAGAQGYYRTAKTVGAKSKKSGV
jgi:hypothetical protein